MLRVVCLVASAVSAGYLWRVTLEGDNELTQLLDTSTPRPPVPTTTFTPPTRAPVSGALSPDRLLAEPERTAPKVSPQSRQKTRPPAGAKPSARGPRATSEPTAAGDSVPGGTGGGAAQPPKSPPKPPAPPAGTPGPKPGPTGGPSAPPAEPAPSPAPAPQPAPLPPAAPEPPVTDAGLPPHWPTSPPDQKPGWGTGDKNHEHSGPPGQSGK